MTAWSTRAWEVIEELAASGRTFLPDDLLEKVGHPDAEHAPNGRNNGVGMLFRQAHKAGLIVPVGTAQSRQPHRKGGMVRAWRGA